MEAENQTADDENKAGFVSENLAPVNVDPRRGKKRNPNPRTSVPARKSRTQRPPNLIKR